MPGLEVAPSGLEVVQPGPLTLIQDPGRFGVAGLGLSQGGPMDLHAFCWANRLLGNPMSAAMLEITLGQASFLAHQDMTLSLCGADMQARIVSNGEARPLANWRSFPLKFGEELQLGTAVSGLRAYLAVKGGFQTQSILGSRATVMRNKLGGINGKKLNRCETLTVSNDSQTNSDVSSTNKVPDRYQPNYSDPVRLELLHGPQYMDYPPEQLATVFDSHYRISPNSDRMGIRFEGQAVKGGPAGMISEGISAGSMQLPPDGQPIIMMSDRQTLGGYPKPFVLSRYSQWCLAQCMPGTEVRFVPGDLTHASKQWQEFVRFFELFE